MTCERSYLGDVQYTEINGSTLEPDFGQAIIIHRVAPQCEWHELSTSPWVNGVLDTFLDLITIGLPGLGVGGHELNPNYVKVVRQSNVLD